MSRKIAVFTGTRADYGLLHGVMKAIQADPSLDLQIIAGAMHWSPEFGSTWEQIVKDGFAIDAKVEMLLSSDSAVGVAKSMGLGVLGFADALERLQPDILVVLGDRFEALAIAQAALVMRIPIAHIHGGEITEGAYDDAIRHAITKMAQWHFVATKAYQQRVIQMGEAPNRVFNTGAVGLDFLHHQTLLSKPQLAKALNFDLVAPYFLVTYHPVTQMQEDPVQTFDAMLAALDEFAGHQIILTYPNADNGGRAIIARLQAYAAGQSQRVLALPSLGSARYLSALAHASAMVGNSSSGVVEAASLHVPTVNIGVRQLGRIAADSVIHCEPTQQAISKALRQAVSESFVQRCAEVINPYDQGGAACRIVEQLRGVPLSTHKSFYDLV